MVLHARELAALTGTSDRQVREGLLKDATNSCGAAGVLGSAFESGLQARQSKTGMHQVAP